jgi:glucose-6-phosphate isomerase
MDVNNIAPPSLINEIENLIQTMSGISDYIVVAGIGGSYLGAKAVIEALSTSFPSKKPQIIYAGHNLSEDYHADLLAFLNNVDYSLIVISKSGTTTETSVSFRLLQKHCEKKYGIRSSQKRIICITDKTKGALKLLADKKGYKSFVIPDDVGGRYSVLSPVGLLPIGMAGFNIKELVQGAIEMSKILNQQKEYNIAVRYALFRNDMLNNGYMVEVMTAFEPKMFYLIEWWKQLFGESEGKNHKGIFPAGAIYTTDLHSMGQYMQEGQRIVFETVLSIAHANDTCIIPHDPDNYDALNYIAGKRISNINTQAKNGTILAHQDGGVPVIEIEMDCLNEKNLGALIYFFEFSCAISGYTLGINPFNQPGVEAYKKNMFALLKKEGYEKEYEILQKRINK